MDMGATAFKGLNESYNEYLRAFANQSTFVSTLYWKELKTACCHVGMLLYEHNGTCWHENDHNFWRLNVLELRSNATLESRDSSITECERAWHST